MVDLSEGLRLAGSDQRGRDLPKVDVPKDVLKKAQELVGADFSAEDEANQLYSAKYNQFLNTLDKVQKVVKNLGTMSHLMLDTSGYNHLEAEIDGVVKLFAQDKTKATVDEKYGNHTTESLRTKAIETQRAIQIARSPSQQAVMTF